MPNEQLPETIEDAFQSDDLPSLLRRFVVNDLTRHLNRCAGQVIMLFESPHFMEVLAGHPLAGRSGRIAFNAFCMPSEDEECPCTVGEILHCELFDQFPCFQRIGVMNVSRLPLQKKLYPYSVRRQVPQELLSAFRVIRKSPGVCVDKRWKKHQFFVALIQEDLENRISRVMCRLGEANVKFVSCGEVAKAYLEHLGVESCHVLPHPATGWDENNAVEAMVDWFHNLTA